MELLSSSRLCLNCDSQVYVAKPAHLGRLGCDLMTLWWYTQSSSYRNSHRVIYPDDCDLLTLLRFVSLL